MSWRKLRVDFGPQSSGFVFVEHDGWVVPTFATDWASVVTVGYLKDPFGWVCLRGQADKSSAFALPDTIFTLPSGYRPSQAVVPLVSANGGAWGEITVNTNGTVQLTQGGGTTYTSLDGIRFPSA